MTKQSPSTKPSWKHGLVPRPIDALSALLYLGLLAVYAYYAFSGFYPLAELCPWVGLAILFLVILILIGLDRLEYWYHHPQVSWQTPVIFQGMRLILAILFVGLVGTAIYVYVALSDTLPGDYAWLGGLVILLALLLLVGLDRLEAWYQQPRPGWLTPIVLNALRMALIWGFSFSDNLGFLDPTYIFLVIPFGIFFLAGKSYGMTGLVWLLYLMARVHVADEIASGKLTLREHNLTFFLTYSVALAFVFSIAYMIKRERTNRLQAEKLLHELEESHRQLQTYADQVAELATIEERNRLARDIHDSLGHYMTVINVQLEKAIVFRDRNPDEADEAVRESKRLASEALQEVRRSVSALRSTAGPFSLTEALQELVDNMNAAGQFTIALDIQGNEAGYSRQTLSTLYRAAQEGLTNIQKHAQASQVTVRVRLNAQEADLSIADNGQGFDPAILAEMKGKSHYGLQGVRERLELIRGSLKLESVPGKGTSLFITVPKNPLALVGERVG